MWKKQTKKTFRRPGQEIVCKTTVAKIRIGLSHLVYKSHESNAKVCSEVGKLCSVTWFHGTDATTLVQICVSL